MLHKLWTDRGFFIIIIIIIIIINCSSTYPIFRLLQFSELLLSIFFRSQPAFILPVGVHSYTDPGKSISYILINVDREFRTITLQKTVFKLHILFSRAGAGIAQSVQRIGTGWAVRGSNPSGNEILRTRPDRPCGPPSLLYNGYRLTFPGVKRSGRGVNNPPHLASKLKKEQSYTSTPLMDLRGLFQVVLYLAFRLTYFHAHRFWYLIQ